MSQAEEPIPPGWKLWLEPHVPEELSKFAMAVRDHVNDYPYGSIAETTTAPDGRTVGAFKSHHTWSFLKQPDGSRKLTQGLWIPGVSLVIQNPAVSPGFGIGDIIPSSIAPHPFAARFPIVHPLTFGKNMISKNDLWDAGKFVLGGGALALAASGAGAALLPAITIGAGGTALFAYLKSKNVHATSVSAEGTSSSSDTGDRILRMSARDLLAFFARTGGPTMNSQRQVWTFQKSWNESSGPGQTGLVLQRDGKYTRDVQNALDMASKAFGISQGLTPAAVL